MSAQPSPQAFTKQDARRARQSHQHVVAVVNRLLNRVMQQLDGETAKRFFKPTVFHTVHALHAFFHGQDLSKKGGELIKSRQFVAPFFDYFGDPKNAAKFIGSRLDALAANEAAQAYSKVLELGADDSALLQSTKVRIKWLGDCKQ